MSNTTTIEAASRRLARALDAIEAALERRQETVQGHQALTAQVHAFGADRSRLASDLDATAARARELETVNREIARRIDAAIETIRSVLNAHDR